MLERLRAAGGSVDHIMDLVRPEPKPKTNGRGHSAGYARFHRLRRRGLVTLDRGRCVLTALGLRALT